MDNALLISRNLPPLIGGMERLMHNTVTILSKHYRLSVIGPRGSKAHLPDNVTVYELPTTPGAFIVLSMLLALWLALSKRYQVVIGGSGVMTPAVVVTQLLARCRSVVFIHGLDIIAQNLVYQGLFVRALRHIDLLVANSHNTKRLAITKAIPAERITIIHPGTDLPKVDRSNARAVISEKYLLGAKKIMLSVGRITPRKGLKEFVEYALPAICRAVPDSLLVVAGDHPAHGMSKSSGLPKKIDELSTELGLQQNILFLGNISDDELSQCYASASCMVFPLIEIPGDVEGFGMVAIEAAAHGTATVAFNVGGVADAIEDGSSGTLIPSGDYTLFADQIIKELQGDTITDTTKCIAFAAQFAWPKFEEQLVCALKLRKEQQHA